MAIAASGAAHAIVIATLSNIRVGPAAPPPEWAEMTVTSDLAETKPAQELPEWEIGQKGAKGYATHDLPGRREQTAREAPQDQPSLSLDPEGDLPRVEVPSRTGNGQYAPPTPDAASAPPASAAAMSRPPLGVDAAPAFAGRVLQDRIASIKPPPAVDAAAKDADGMQVAMATPTLPPPRSPAAATPQEAHGGTAVPAPPAAAARPILGSGADPAPQSDSESDAFSVLGSADVRGGRVTVRAGRQVKTRRPRIGLAGMVELAKRDTAQVELKVSVDRTGKVTDVDIARSSGSNDIDQPCRVAMYEWWFEPKKDAAGRAVPDVFKFTISFR